ncbi:MULTISPECIES: hypothetical protein [unclassified Paenibacillus]|uniref:hypothetical protein n=1 Tax=unclassified Paenibacillus TaxID=185978 RepID=UPI0024061AD1|nr:MULTISPECIES: hypothetical protein [unclassified Paenibacillus]MDF9845071.1 hypothetical protein [Paenibacillus sp. PastF-2]MDF9851698.1 hypothetical protein [Paenibacillus sp. PastM-2]MDF9858282.1 hypothetical protein [Paenibacillus sp. PastF-1]MDH6483546.1 hypothetical protein [Paenibacillus sp. PastH-2]MDH6510930.1 hypothetical protein [Paenibacillus sp. PastM-3]
MNIHDIKFESELPRYKIADEKNTFFADRPSKEINIEFLDQQLKLMIETNGIRHTFAIKLWNFTLIELMNKDYRDEDVDKSISVNNQIYFDITTLLTNKLNAEQVLGNPCISNEKFNQLIDDEGYRVDCFHNIIHFIHTYKAHPSEEDLTLFLLGTTGGLLAEFLYEQGVVYYSREKYGYALTFRNSQIATDYFIIELIECMSRLGFACQALALDYM